MKGLLAALLLLSFCSCANKKSSTTAPLDSTNTNDTTDNTLLKRADYSLQYGTDWTIDSSDKDFNLDHYFTLNSPSNDGFVSFFVFDASINEQDYVDRQVNAQLGHSVKDGQVTYFESWGNYKGTGAIITGKLQGIWKGKISIFAHTGNRCSFMAVSELFDNDVPQDAAGLNLIDSTFKIKQ